MVFGVGLFFVDEDVIDVIVWGIFDFDCSYFVV